MFAAPPVAVRCTARWAWRAFQTALPSLAAGVLLFWGLSIRGEELAGELHFGAPLAAALLVGALAWWRSSEQPHWLDWDGQRWAVDGHAGSLQLMIDLGQALLVRHDGRRWLLVSRRDAGGAWHAMRVAVHARAPGATTADDGWPHA